MNYSELLQLVKGWSNLVSNRIIIWRLRSVIPRRSHAFLQDAPDVMASLISNTAFLRSEALIIRPLDPPRSHLLFLTVQVKLLLLQEPFPCAVILFQVFCVLSQNP